MVPPSLIQDLIKKVTPNPSTRDFIGDALMKGTLTGGTTGLAGYIGSLIANKDDPKKHEKALRNAALTTALGFGAGAGVSGLQNLRGDFDGPKDMTFAQANPNIAGGLKLVTSPTLMGGAGAVAGLAKSTAGTWSAKGREALTKAVSDAADKLDIGDGKNSASSNVYQKITAMGPAAQTETYKNLVARTLAAAKASGKLVHPGTDIPLDAQDIDTYLGTGRGWVGDKYTKMVDYLRGKKLPLPKDFIGPSKPVPQTWWNSILQKAYLPDTAGVQVMRGAASIAPRGALGNALAHGRRALPLTALGVGAGYLARPVVNGALNTVLSKEQLEQYIANLPKNRQ